MSDLTQQGISAYKTGNKPKARSLFIAALKQNQNDETAWLGLAHTVDDLQQKKDCLLKVLNINPANTLAKKALDKIIQLTEQKPQPKTPAPSHLSTATNIQQSNSLVLKKSDVNFVAVDVETANSDYSSICQIGIVTFCNGQITDQWQTFLNPCGAFSKTNIRIHGIKPEQVIDSPQFPTIYQEFQSRLDNKIVACYSPFDQNAITQACQKFNLPPINCTWLDITQIVRTVWQQFARRGYGLGNVAKELGIEFEHHNAQEDARVAGIILLKALESSEIPFEKLVKKSYRPAIYQPKPKPEPNHNGHLLGRNYIHTFTVSFSAQVRVYKKRS